jgi:hypothetical protein
MGDFVPQSNVKSAVRELATPIADVAAFNTIVQSVLTTNPFGCTAYETSGDQMPAVAKSRENYTARVLYEDDEANLVGTVSARASTIAGFNAAKAAILADTDLTTAMGGDAVNDAEGERYSVTLRCHDPSGELYYVSFSRTEVRVTSYEADAILATVETWADTIPALA